MISEAKPPAKLDPIRARLGQMFALMRLLPAGELREASRDDHAYLCARVNALDTMRASSPRPEAEKARQQAIEQKTIELLADLERADDKLVAQVLRHGTRHQKANR